MLGLRCTVLARGAGVVCDASEFTMPGVAGTGKVTAGTLFAVLGGSLAVTVVPISLASTGTPQTIAA